MVLWYLFINTLKVSSMLRENKYIIIFVSHNLNVWGWAIRDAWQIAFKLQRMFIQVMCFFGSSLHSIYGFFFSNINKELLNYYIKGNCLKNNLTIFNGVNIMTNEWNPHLHYNKRCLCMLSDFTGLWVNSLAIMNIT